MEQGDVNLAGPVKVLSSGGFQLSSSIDFLRECPIRGFQRTMSMQGIAQPGT
jgi:hypothetical protein